MPDDVVVTPPTAHLKVVAPQAPQPERRPVLGRLAQAWPCPFCGRANAIPERRTCECGAAADATWTYAER